MRCQISVNLYLTYLLDKKNYNTYFLTTSLRKKVLLRSFFSSVFFCIWTEYGDLLRKSLYSVRVQESTDQKTSVFGHFSCSVSVYRLCPKQVLKTNEPNLFRLHCSQSNHHKQGFSITTSKISYSLIEPQVPPCVPTCRCRFHAHVVYLNSTFLASSQSKL